MTPILIQCGDLTVELWTDITGPVPPPGPEVDDATIESIERELAVPEVPCPVVDATAFRLARRSIPGISLEEAVRMATIPTRTHKTEAG